MGALPIWSGVSPHTNLTLVMMYYCVKFGRSTTNQTPYELLIKKPLWGKQPEHWVSSMGNTVHEGKVKAAMRTSS